MTALNLLIFILVFGGMVIIHELGHYLVARWNKVEVEEFGIGLPTPGAITLWSGKGFLFLRNGKRIEIPFNFKFPLNWNDLVDTEAKITVDDVNDRLVMRSISGPAQGTKTCPHHREGQHPCQLERKCGRIAGKHPHTGFS